MEGAVEETLLYQFTKISLSLLKILGLWLKSRVCSWIVTTVFIIINIPHLLAQLIELEKAPSDVEIVVPLLLRLTAIIAIFCKALFIVWKKIEIQQLHFNWDNVQGLQEYLKRFRREVLAVHIIYGMCMFIAGSIWFVRPSFLLNQATRSPHDGHGQRELPIGGWYPFDLNSTLTYTVIVIQQLLTMVIYGFSSHGCNMLFLTTAMFISKLLSFLNYQLAQVPKSTNIKQRICELGKLQEEIFEFTRKADALFSTITYIHLVKSITVFLISTFRATAPGVELRDSMWHLQGMYSQLFFFYLVTRYAGDVVDETYKVLDITFMWPWEDWPLDVQQNMQALRATSLQPAALTAGIYTLNRDFFLKGLGIAMSAYMLLHNVRYTFGL